MMRVRFCDTDPTGGLAAGTDYIGGAFDVIRCTPDAVVGHRDAGSGWEDVILAHRVRTGWRTRHGSRIWTAFVVHDDVLLQQQTHP